MDKSSLALLLLAKLEEGGLGSDVAQAIVSSSFMASRAAHALDEVFVRSMYVAETCATDAVRSLEHVGAILDSLPELEADVRYTLTERQYKAFLSRQIVNELMS